MAFTSNINTAVERAQQQVQAEQNQRLTQERSQQFAAEENQKSRDFQERMYNIQAGDAWMVRNPMAQLSDEEVDDLGEDVFNVHANAIKQKREGRKLLFSGNTQDRVKGQQMLTQANKSIKELRLQYDILEEDTQAYLEENNLDSQSHQTVQAVAEAFTDGRVRIVSSKTAGSTDESGKWIEYTDEETGEKNFVNFKDYKRMLKSGVKRVDVPGWVENVSSVLETDDITNSDGTRTKRLRSPEALDTHIDDLLSDDDTVNALLQQFSISTDDPSMSVAQKQENDLNTLRERLKQTLQASKGILIDREPTPVKTDKSSTKPDKRAGGLSHRHWQIIQGSQEDPKKAEQFLLGELKGTSPIKGVGVGDQVKDVKVDPVASIITLTFEGEAPPLRVAWKQGAINDLFNSFATNIDEQKYNLADVTAATPTQAVAASPDTSGEVEARTNRDIITDIISDFTNEETGKVDTANLVKALREGTEFGEVLDKAQVTNTQPFIGPNKIKFFGTTYNLNDQSERTRFIDAFSKKVGEGNDSPKTDAFGNPID